MPTIGRARYFRRPARPPQSPSSMERAMTAYPNTRAPVPWSISCHFKGSYPEVSIRLIRSTHHRPKLGSFEGVGDRDHESSMRFWVFWPDLHLRVGHMSAYGKRI